MIGGGTSLNACSPTLYWMVCSSLVVEKIYLSVRDITGKLVNILETKIQCVCNTGVFFCVHHPWTGTYVWPSSCIVKSLLISSRQIYQAAVIFEKWASQQVWHGLLWGEFHRAFCQCFSLTTVISYWNPCIWLAESKFVSEKLWQNTKWNAPRTDHATPAEFLH